MNGNPADAELWEAAGKIPAAICDKLPGAVLPDDLSWEDISTAITTVCHSHATQLGYTYRGLWRLMPRSERARILEEMTARIVADCVTVLLGLGVAVPETANRGNHA